MPSIFLDMSITFATLGSSAYIFLRSGLASMALSRVISRLKGMALAILSASEYERLRALPTSLTAALAFMVPKVII